MGGNSWSGGGGGWKPWTPQFQKGWGKSGGKGKRSSIKDPSKVIWVGGLSEGTTYQELKAHGEQAGSAKWAEVYNNKGKGTGVIGYATAEEAAGAAAMLNGSLLKGAVIQTDAYAKASK